MRMSQEMQALYSKYKINSFSWFLSFFVSLLKSVAEQKATILIANTM